MTMSTHESTHTSASHLNKFYVTFPEISKKHFDGMIITGAPVELMEFEEVNYWEELHPDHGVEQDPCDIHDASLLGGAGRACIIITESRNTYEKKNFPVCIHRKRWISVFRCSRSFDDYFKCPHSRYTEVRGGGYLKASGTPDPRESLTRQASSS